MEHTVVSLSTSSPFESRPSSLTPSPLHVYQLPFLASPPFTSFKENDFRLQKIKDRWSEVKPMQVHNPMKDRIQVGEGQNILAANAAKKQTLRSNFNFAFAIKILWPNECLGLRSLIRRQIWVSSNSSHPKPAPVGLSCMQYEGMLL